ncbi:MAG: tetratricopeptide repeat protein [Deltaproteobacteria bacterium]|nr:tetratricopeptide repeat protein [Deltaproteobacteria bacterium]MBW2353945.1 tetratricopeptide repeat protein [Deltaproteobacteria bacterium]HDZ90636.1 tetratricopeptide repeat protein [Deltaproteobacteria bacterium]
MMNYELGITNHDGKRGFGLRLSYSFLAFLLLLMAAGCAGERVVNKKRADALEQLGMAYVAEGNSRKGLAKLLEAVEIDPDNPDLNHEIALVLRNLGEYKLSLRYFKRALALKPRYPDAMNNLGTLYLLMGEEDSALSCFKEAASDILYSTPQFAYNNMGYAYFKKGEYDRAIENYRLALKASPSYPLCLYNLGQAYEAKGDLKGAVAAYRRSVSYSPRDAGAHLQLARVLLKLGRNKEAKEELGLTIWADPSGPQAKEAREMLKAFPSAAVSEKTGEK